ncbi:MAG: hypothetical protein JOZ19_04275 [Rubrobacter sp.]|nr:hypothetical protein [Rubrobacter sp.]
MPNKDIMRFIRFSSIYVIVAGVALLLAPESMGKLSRWFADNPRYLRLAGMLDISLGIWLARQRYQAEAPPILWWRK